MDFDYLFKIIIIGDSGCGKSSLLLRYVDSTFSENFIATIGVDFKIKTVNYNDQRIKLQLWDTAGQERFRTLTTSYYRGAHAVILVYDCHDVDSFKNLERWLKDTEKTCQFRCIKMLAGCKYDVNTCVLPQITEEEGRVWAKENNMTFVATSAKHDVNVNELFEQLCEQVTNKTNTLEQDLKNKKLQKRFTGAIKLNQPKSNQRNSSVKCC